MTQNHYPTVYQIYEDYMGTCNPNAVCIHFNDRTVTNAELKELVDVFTKHLIHLGVKPGTRIGYSMPNCPELFALFFSIARLGGCAIPLFHMIPDIGKCDIFSKCGAQIVIVSAQQYPAFKECSARIQANHSIVSIDECPEASYHFATPVSETIDFSKHVLKTPFPTIPFIIASSSGTTGIPKLVIMTQSNIAVEIYAGMSLVPNVKASALAFPLSTSGIITCAGVLLANVACAFSADVNPVKFMQLVSQWKVDSISGPPAYFEALLSLPMLDTFDLSTVRSVQSGMDFFSPSLLQRLKAKFVNITAFANGYGLIETSNVFLICSNSSVDNFEGSTTLMSVAVPGANEIQVRNEEGTIVPAGSEGELYVKGANVVQGYINNPEETQKSFQDGWFKTGDIVRYEGGQSVTLLGRKKDLIKRGGKSVSPIEVQNIINQIPGIKTSAVVGIPHQLYGEMVWAFVVRMSESAIEFKDIMKHCRANLANYMVPDQISFVDDIPKNPGVGKVNYAALKQIANAELQAMNGGKNE
jgi:acyl-coenzyme A synthetase/AMP-(fatty) acid ligase